MIKYDYEKSPQGIAVSNEERNFNYSSLTNIIEGLPKKEIRILEIGCGGGRNLKILKNKFKDRIAIFGTDISITAINYAISLGIGDFAVSNSDKVPFSGNFDLILLIDILEHLDSKQEVTKTLDVALSKLNTDGKVYISLPIELNRFTLTWVFSKANLLKKLTHDFFGHTIQFSELDFMEILNIKVVTIKEKFYSVHFMTQLQMLFFFYIPKIALKLVFGDSAMLKTKDSNEIISGGKSFLSLIKPTFLLLSKPLSRLAYLESSFRKSSKFGAGNIHLLIVKSQPL